MLIEKTEILEYFNKHHDIKKSVRQKAVRSCLFIVLGLRVFESEFILTNKVQRLRGAHTIYLNFTN